MAADSISSAELANTPQANTLDKIERRLQALPEKPPYLYETNSVTGAISSTWVEMTSGLLGTKEVRDKYDEFFLAASEYQNLAKTQLLKAEQLAKQGNLEMANHYVAESERSLKQFSLSSQGAFEAYQGNLAAAGELAKGIYEGSKAAVKYGVNFTGMGPAAAQKVDAVFDTIFDVTDFAVNATDMGASAAAKKMLADKMASAILDAKLPSLGGKSASDVLTKEATKEIGQSGLYEALQGFLKSEETKQAVMEFVAQSSAYAVNEMASGKLSEMLAPAMSKQVETLAKVPSAVKPTMNTALLQNQLTAITQGNSSHIGSAALFTGYGKAESSVDPNNTGNSKVKTGVELAGYAVNTQAFQASTWQVITGTASTHLTEGNAFGPINAPDGGNITALNNANVQYTHMVKEFQVPVGVKQVTLTLNGNFVTNEYPAFVGSQYNDYGVVKLISPSGTVTEVTAFKETLNSSNFQNVLTLPAPLEQVGGQTGFKPSVATIPVANGGKVIVDVQVHNVGDMLVPSAVLMNNIQLK
ncbi:MAG: hypothetical protein AB1513_02910 [Pseudomonadota bacterium]